MVAAYDHRGAHIFTGNSRGRVMVVTAEDNTDRKEGDEVKEPKVISVFKVSQQVSDERPFFVTRTKENKLYFAFQVSSTTAIKSIEFSKRGKSFLVNTADRVIRVYNTDDALNLKETDK